MKVTEGGISPFFVKIAWCPVYICIYMCEKGLLMLNGLVKVVIKSFIHMSAFANELDLYQQIPVVGQ